MVIARRESERGAILIYVAVSMLALVGGTMWVVDYGVLLLARNQAQNSADAGALAGAVAMAYDDAADRSITGPARVSARALALANDVVAEDPVVDIVNDVYFYPDDPTAFPAECADDTCVRVDVYRNQASGNPLQTFFGATVGVTEQGVWATATARAVIGNASDCVLPFGIPDKWIDWYDEDEPIEPPGQEKWTDDDVFEPEEVPLDVYSPPTQDGVANPGMTGFTLADDLGRLMTLKAGGPHQAISPGFYFPVRLPLANPDDPENPLESTGADDYEHNIANCNGSPSQIGDLLWTEPGNMVGPTSHGMRDLYDQDPSATWDPNTNSVINSCAQATPSCGSKSPRLRPLILFDTGAFYAAPDQNGLSELRIANSIGFFINEINGNEVTGYVATTPGLLVGGGVVPATSAAFIRTVLLIR